MILIPEKEVLLPMKTIVVDNIKKDAMTKAYLTQDPKDTHTKEEMDSLIRAIMYTKMVKQQESLDKMNEEELIERPLPRMM
jgi:hypothetical protein